MKRLRWPIGADISWKRSTTALHHLRGSTWARWPVYTQHGSTYSSFGRNQQASSAAGEEFSCEVLRNQSTKKHGVKSGKKAYETSTKRIRFRTIPDGYFKRDAAKNSSTGNPLIRRVEATAEEESNLGIHHQEQKVGKLWAQRIIAQLDSKEPIEDGEVEETNISSDPVIWTLRERAHNDPSLREKYEASKNLDDLDFGFDKRWAMRLQTQLDPSLRTDPKRAQNRRLLTRQERRDVLELSSGLQEALDFAETIKREPWTDEELELGNINGEETTKRLSALHIDSLAVEELRADDFTIKEDIMNSENDEDIQGYDTLFSFTSGRPISSTSVLAGYIDLTVRQPVLPNEQYNQLLLELFNDQALAFLATNGDYTIEDIVAWAWILEADSNHVAVMRLLIWTNRPLPEKRVPRVVLHLLLKRRYLEPSTIQLLATHLNHRIANTIDPKWATVYMRFISGKKYTMNLSEAHSLEHERGRYRGLAVWRRAVCILILIKHAATVVPILLPNLVMMLCKHVQLPGIVIDGLERRLSHRAQASFNKIFNKAIEFAARKSTDPFLNVAYQERAQFILIRHMSTFRPPLTLSLEAYRAVVSVQLRHRKTVKERLWTELKSKAWPPYREDKLGIDAHKKQEDYGISRAQRAIVNLKEAGYSPTEWEDSASVLSGWDVTRSPTIQSRRLFLDRASSRMPNELRMPRSSIWQSRILSTRTIEEAWAIFLDYIEEDVQKDPSVFRAMFEKIISERKRLILLAKVQNLPISSVLAGDALETVASSRNPREQTYVSIPPPDIGTFFERYQTYFAMLDTETLCLLLPHAESLTQAYDFVEKSDLTKMQKDILLRKLAITGSDIPIVSKVLTSYIRVLCSFGSNPLPNISKVSALSHALHLVIAWNPKQGSPWRALLQGIEKDIKYERTRTFWHQQWTIMLDVLRRMEKRGVHQDSAIFYTVCSIFVRLLRLASQVSASGQHHRHTPGYQSTSEMRVRTGIQVKRIFKRMVTVDLRAVFSHTEAEIPFLPLSKDDSTTDPSNSIEFSLTNLLPHILYTPSPAAIHLFVQLLAMLEDRKAIHDLVKWLAMYHQEIAAKVAELAGGSKQFRFALIAVRVAMESSSTPFVSRQRTLDLSKSNLPYAEETKKLVESVEDWHGWPSDQEVNNYMKNWVHFSESDSESDEDASLDE